jgi:glycosyltransferase involved in cell wall biosynthesis
MRPFISILIPAYNAREWIADTIKSAMDQTWQRKEIIVIDDGSTDGTLAIAQRFEGPQVRLISQKNQGGPAARNYALSLSQGDFLQWLDHDDLLHPEKIAKQMAIAEHWPSKRTLFSSEWGTFLYRKERAKLRPTALWCDLTPAEFLMRKLEQNLFMQTSNWLVTRELSEAAGSWDSRMLTDDDG